MLFFQERLPKFVSADNHLDQSAYLAMGAIVNRLYDLNPKSPVSKIEKNKIRMHSI